MRTDPHAPHALITEDYVFGAIIDFSDDLDAGAEPAVRSMVIQRLAGEGIIHGGVHGYARCDHCGAHLRYAAVMIHQPTSSYIHVGETCLENRFSQATKAFHEWRKRTASVRSGRERDGEREAYLAKNPDLRVLLDTTQDVPFLADLAHTLRVYGKLTDRQAAAARKVLAEEEDGTPSRGTLPDDLPRRDWMGRIIKIKYGHNRFGETLRMTVLVDMPDGQCLINGNVPVALRRDSSDLQGRFVAFTAQVTPSDDDPSFGFFKSPRDARFVRDEK